MVIVDSHQHFWNPAQLDLPAPPPGFEPLDRAFLPGDLEPELHRAGVDVTVLVQGYPQTKACNRWLFQRAEESSFVAGVVAWVDLECPDSLVRNLEELEAQPKFVGIRHIVQGEPALDWIVQDTVLASLGELARRNIPYDMVVKPQHLPSVLKVLEKIPELAVVINHIAKPDIAHGGSPHWADHLAEIARWPQVYCKLSGLATEADWKCWRPSDLKPYVESVFEWFGFDRVMYGSDWPVCLLAASYQRTWDALNDLLADVGEENYGKVFGKNASRFYRLNLDDEENLRP